MAASRLDELKKRFEENPRRFFAPLANEYRKAGDLDQAIALCDTADVLIEGFRPGVMERLGLGPDILCRRNDRLVYGRMTGWGQDGPLAQRAGHDINYIALAGALNAIGRRGQAPSVPLMMDLVKDETGKRALELFATMNTLGRSFFAPPGAPVLLQIHGGGWIIGEKGQQGQPLMHLLAAHGWASRIEVRTSSVCMMGKKPVRRKYSRSSRA